MASRGVLLQALFTQFYSLIGELREMFPDDADFPVYETAIRAIQKTNPSLLLHHYKTNIVETGFGEKILARDESFFLDYRYSEYDSADVIGKLKQYWKVLSPESQSAVWAYVLAIHQIATRLSKSD